MSLFWRVFAINALVLTVATAVLVLSPATVSSPVAVTEALVLALGLGAMGPAGLGLHVYGRPPDLASVSSAVSGRRNYAAARGFVWHRSIRRACGSAIFLGMQVRCRGRAPRAAVAAAMVLVAAAASAGAIAPDASGASRGSHHLGSATLGAQVGTQLGGLGAEVFCDEVQRDGARATALWLRRPQVDRGGGRYDWRKLDRDLARMRMCGIGVGLHVQARVPHAAGSEDVELEDYGRFVRDLAIHLRGRVKRYSIENEPNAERLRPGTPEQYFAMLARARREIKAVDPGAQVQHGGVSGGGLGFARVHDLYRQGRYRQALALMQEVQLNLAGGGGGEERRVRTIEQLGQALKIPGILAHSDWMRRELANQRLTDAFQVHYYGPWRRLAELMRWIRAEGIKRPLEVWELGMRYWNNPFTERRHALETAKQVLVATGEGSRFTVFVRYFDWPATRLPGLLTAAGPREARTAYRTVATKLAGVRRTKPLRLGRGLWGYRFARPGKDLYVAWSTSPKRRRVDFGFHNRRARVTTLDGAISRRHSARLRVGEAPIFVEP